MVESTAVSCIHPDNNSVDRIISKEEEREDPRRDSSIYLRIQCTVVFPHIQELQCFHRQSSNSKIFLHTELILLQEILQLQGSSRADHYKASSSDCSHASKHSTWQNKAPGSPTVLQAYTALAGFQLILPSRIALQVAASIHAAPTVAATHIPTEFYQEK